MSNLQGHSVKPPIMAVFKNFARPFISRGLEHPVFRECFIGYTNGMLPLSKNFALQVINANRLRNSDAIISHDVFALPAAISLRNTSDKVRPIVAFDAIEVPWMDGRTGSVFRNLPKSGSWRISKMEHNCIAMVDEIVTISHPLADELVKRYHKPIDVIHHRLSAIQNFKLPAINNTFTKTIFIHGTHSEETGVHKSFEILKHLDKSWGLVVLGQFREAEYKNRCQQLIEAMDLQDQVQFNSWASREELSKWLDNCDVGLIQFDRDIDNLRLGFPHRACDLLGAGLPAVITGIKALSKLEATGTNGLRTDVYSPEDVAMQLEELASTKKDLKPELRKQANIMNNENHQGLRDLYKRMELSPGKTLCVLARKVIQNNTRIDQMKHVADEMGINFIAAGYAYGLHEDQKVWNRKPEPWEVYFRPDDTQ